jgi:membrane protein
MDKTTLLQTFVYAKRLWAAVQRSHQASASLSYTTLFAVVPLLTVIYAVLSAIPYFHGVGEQLQRLILTNFMPNSGAVVQTYIMNFVSHARKLTWLGVAILAITAVMMLMTVEGAFSQIWRAQNKRRVIKSLTMYWLLISVGPILVGAGFILSSYLTSIKLFSGAAQLFESKALLQWLPLLFNTIAFTMMYKIIPHSFVKITHAAMGGLWAAVIFEVTKGLFTQFVAHSTFSLIYGAFAAVPLFLMWIYVSWLIILLGAEFVHALSKHTQL